MRIRIKRLHSAFLNPRGSTLLEVVLVIVLISGVIAGLMVVVPKVMRTVSTTKSRGVANHLALSQMESVRARPYPVIPVTSPGSYFQTPQCDCTQVDWSSWPPEFTQAHQSGAITYTERTCINYAGRIPGAPKSQCSPDTGLKQVVVNESWQVGLTPETLTLQTLVSPGSQYKTPVASTGVINITVCAADQTPAANCDFSKNSTIQKSEGAAYNNSITVENAHQTAGSPPMISLVVPAGTYDVHVQHPDFFPIHWQNVSVAPNQVVHRTAVLRQITTYGSNLEGEAFESDFPVVSKVLTQVLQTCPPKSICVGPDYTEALEIFNPTSSTFTFGNGGNIDVVFFGVTGSISCKGSQIPPCYSSTEISLNQELNASLIQENNPTLLPGHYFLIVGYDSHLYSKPSDALGVKPDIYYDVWNPALWITKLPEDGLIASKRAGGIMLTDTTGNLLDYTGWQGLDNSFIYPPTTGANNWPGGTVFPWQAVTPVTPSSSYTNVLIRASRRGQALQFSGSIPNINSPTSVCSMNALASPFQPSGAPGNWGPSYGATGGSWDMCAVFGTWPYASGAIPPQPTFYNHNSSALYFTGTPAGSDCTNLPGAKTFIQVNDPTSPPTPICLINQDTGAGNSLTPNPHQTAIFNATSLFGGFGATQKVPQWPGFVVTGTDQKSFVAPVLSTFNAPSLWPVLGPPPQPCLGGSCDTDQKTIPGDESTDGLPYADTSYGVNPDSHTSYIVLNASVPWSWCGISGSITVPPGNSTLGAIPVVAHDPLNRYAPIEKVTDNFGNFQILLPACSPANPPFLVVNSTAPEGPNTPHTHFYDAHYSSATATADVSNMNFTGACSGVPNPLVIPLTTIAATPINSNTGSITGSVISAGTLTTLPLIPVQLRDANGYVVSTVLSDTDGNYTFDSLPANQYSVTPVTEGHETASPLISSVTVTGGIVPGPTITMTGVPAFVTVQSQDPGTYIILYATSVASGVLPTLPVISPQKDKLIYSALIPGGMAGETLNSPQLSVEPGSNYNLLCYYPQKNGSYLKGSLVSVKDGKKGLKPNTTYTAICK